MLCTVVRVEKSGGAFQVLAPSGAMKLEGGGASEATPMTVIIKAGAAVWAYLVGGEPEVQINDGPDVLAQIGANGSQIIVQWIPAAGSTLARARAFLLSSAGNDPTAYITVGSQSAAFAIGEYVDAEFDSNGALSKFTSPQAYDPDNLPVGSETIFETVESEATSRGLPW